MQHLINILAETTQHFCLLSSSKAHPDQRLTESSQHLDDCQNHNTLNKHEQPNTSMHKWLYLSLSEVNTRALDWLRKPTFTTLFLSDTILQRQTHTPDQTCFPSLSVSHLNVNSNPQLRVCTKCKKKILLGFTIKLQ